MLYEHPFPSQENELMNEFCLRLPTLMRQYKSARTQARRIQQHKAHSHKKPAGVDYDSHEDFVLVAKSTMYGNGSRCAWP